MSTVADLADRAKVASRSLARLSTKKKNALLLAVAEQLEAREKEILQANRGDVQIAKETG
jgi:glutamate-5-semialdehyde dehydrogenase